MASNTVRSSPSRPTLVEWNERGFCADTMPCLNESILPPFSATAKPFLKCGETSRPSNPVTPDNSIAKSKTNKRVLLLRFYDKDKHLTIEIGFHREPDLTGHNREVYHIHEYQRDNFTDRKPRLFTECDLKKYGKHMCLACQFVNSKCLRETSFLWTDSTSP